MLMLTIHTVCFLCINNINKFSVVFQNLTTVFFLHRVNGHDVAAGLVVKTAGPQIANISDAKGRWVLL